MYGHLPTAQEIFDIGFECLESNKILLTAGTGRENGVADAKHAASKCKELTEIDKHRRHTEIFRHLERMPALQRGMAMQVMTWR